MNLRAAYALAFLLAFPPALAAPQAGPAPSPSRPDAARPTTLDLVTLPEATGIALSPDGSRIAYTVRTKQFDPAAKPSPDFDPAKAGDADLKAGWTVATQIWVVPAPGGEPRQLTYATDPSTSPVWSPDGGTLGFLRKKDGKARIHLLGLGGGEARVLDTGALVPHAFAFSPDGLRVAFTASLPLSEAQKQASWASGGAIRWEREWQPTALHVVEVAGGKPTTVTGPGVNVVDFDWSPDGRRFAALLSPTSDPYEASSLQRPAVVTPRQGGEAEIRWLEEKPRTAAGIRWSPDGKHVAYALGVDTLTLVNQLLVHEADGAGRWNAAARLDPTIVAFTWSDNGSLLALVAERTASRVYRLARDGSTARDVGFSGRVIRPPLSADRSGKKLAFLSSTPDDPWSPTVLDPRTGRAQVVVPIAPEVASWPRPRTEVVSWKNPGGQVIEGILTLPPGTPPGAKPPLWVFPHGGPDDVSQLSWSRWTPSIVARGYAVLQPNYRGGTGYGRDFYAANRGRLGEVEFQDIESGVDALVAAGRVDPDRLFFGSWSWGGYLTAWTIGHTRRYRAAVAGAAVVDTVSQYALSDVNHGVAGEWEFLGNPWQQEGHARANPVTHLRNARTPTLILHGQADDRVPFSQGQILFRALSDVGCEVEFLAYPREPHGFQEPAHWVHMLDAWAAWFDRHGGKPQP
jgi:dipeptidyl aminopeptidase/acylaminoacyl peptidase